MIELRIRQTWKKVELREGRWFWQLVTRYRKRGKKAWKKIVVNVAPFEYAARWAQDYVIEHFMTEGEYIMTTHPTFKARPLYGDEAHCREMAESSAKAILSAIEEGRINWYTQRKMEEAK